MKAGELEKREDHVHLHLDHIDSKIIDEKLPGIAESAKKLSQVSM